MTLDSAFSWLRPRRGLILTWAITVAAIWIGGAFIGGHCAPARPEQIFPRTAVETLSTFDGTQYEWIARNGYSVHGDERRRFALFPLLPLIARALGGVEHCALAGIFVNQICLLASVLFLSTFAERAGPRPLFQQPGFWLLMLPTGFFLSVFYAESSLLLLSLLMVVAYRKKRFDLACVAGVLAGLSRPTLARAVAILFGAAQALFFLHHTTWRWVS